MKTILVPTDFSPASLGAIDYAAGLAKAVNARLVLLHVYHMPLITSEIPVPVLTMQEMDKECRDCLKKLAFRLRKKYGSDPKIEWMAACGFAAEEIPKAAGEMQAGMIIMGMRGSGFLAGKFLGSVTASVMKRTPVPVLVVHEKNKFRPIHKIAMACDSREMVPVGLLGKIKKLARLLNAKIHAFSVVYDPELITVPAPVTEQHIAQQLKGVEHSFEYTWDDDIIPGINRFVEKNKMDLLVMFPHKKRFLADLFRSHSTQKEAFYTRVPMLSIKE